VCNPQRTATAWEIRLLEVQFFVYKFVPLYVLNMLGDGQGGVWVRSGTVRLHPDELPPALEGVALNMSMDGDLQTDDAAAQAAGGEGEVQVCVRACVWGGGVASLSPVV
jgi:hypothetical protein